MSEHFAHPETHSEASLSRRDWLRGTGLGLGGIALSTLLQQDSQGGTSSSAQHHAPRAKRVIFFHMVGAPSQLDLFDPKPMLQKHHGQLLPEDLWDGLQLAFIRKRPKLFGSPFSFSKYGEGGMELSELLPNLAQVSDDITLIRSMHTEQINHAPAQLFMQTGFARFGRPCFGSWISYGLGTENENLPSFVVLNTGTIAGAGNSLWGSGFLPSVHQGVEFRSKGDPVLYLSNPGGIDSNSRQRIVESVNQLNQIQFEDAGDAEIETRIKQYEMAFRMQSSVPELMDLQSEPKEIHELYGTDPGKESFANNCLLARRMVERGIRFVQLCDQGWDSHGSLAKNLRNKCQQTDRPVAALIKDLKQRGLLEDTLVVFASEFGRTPMLQGKLDQSAGRDHHRHAFSIWMAGGGVAGGRTIGKTDELGFNAVESPIHVNDLHATLLHLLGIDHEKLVFKFQGRQYRLTDVAGKVIEPILA